MESASPSLIGFFMGIGGAESAPLLEFTLNLKRMPDGAVTGSKELVNAVFAHAPNG